MKNSSPPAFKQFIAAVICFSPTLYFSYKACGYLCLGKLSNVNWLEIPFWEQPILSGFLGGIFYAIWFVSQGKKRN